MKNKFIKLLQFFIDVAIIFICLFVIGYNLKNADIVNTLLPLGIIAIIVFIPLFLFSRVIPIFFLRKSLKIYYRGTFFFIIILSFISMALIISNGIQRYFRNNELWSILLSYYYPLIVIYCFIFNNISAFFSVKVNMPNEKQINRKFLIFYLCFLLILPLFINKINPHSFLIHI